MELLRYSTSKNSDKLISLDTYIEQMKEREIAFYKNHKPNTLNNKTYKKEFKIRYGYPEFDEGGTNSNNENDFERIELTDIINENENNNDNDIVNGFKIVTPTEIKAAQNVINQRGRKKTKTK